MQEIELHRRVIGQILADRAAETPERNFVHIGGATYTYGAMYESSSEVAGALASLGVERGKRVVMMLANRIEFIFGWFGTALAGGTIVPINPDWKGETLSYILTDAEPTVVILSAELLGVMSILETLPSVEAVVVCDAGVSELRSDRIRMLRWEDLEGLDTSACCTRRGRRADRRASSCRTRTSTPLVSSGATRTTSAARTSYILRRPSSTCRQRCSAWCPL
jgi:acyl-CoA synthetase (AMP-forming)/AMP-acid ligase II